jgi:branched-chain amino acid transport system permease protein
MVDVSLIADVSRGFLAPAFVFALLALALNVQWGHTGLFNAGIAGFFAMGAYIGAIFATPPEAPRTGVPGHAGLANLFPQAIPAEALWALWLAAALSLALGMLRRRRPRRRLARRLVVVGFALLLAAAAGTTLRVVGVPTPLVVGGLVAMAATGLAGLLIAIPTLRLRADYLAIGTLALSAIIVESIRNLESVTGGVFGITTVTRPWEFGTETYKTEAVYAAFLGVLVLVVFLLINRATRAPWGRILRAVREDEDAALALGKNTYFYKVQAFVLGCALMGFAGVQYTVLIRALFPDPFVPALTFGVVVMVIVGGAGSNVGVVVGALALTFLEYFTVRAKDWFDLPTAIADRIFFLRLILIGSLLVILVLVRPRGLLPEPRKVAKKPRLLARGA